MAGIAVTFAVTAGGGSVTGGNQSTGATGVATVGDWTLGMTVGENTLTATVAGLTPVIFRAQAAPGDPATLLFTSQPINAVAGTVLPAVTVELRDQYGNKAATATRTVTLAIATNPGGATLAGSPSVATAEGVARFADLVLDRSSDGYTLTASAAGLPSATSAAFNIAAGAPVALTKVTGDNQTGTVGMPVPIRPAVRLTDALGNPVVGRGINFSAGFTTETGHVTGATVPTGPDGVATVGTWTLGTIAGTQLLTASMISGPATTHFGATATPGSPAAMSKTSPEPQPTAVVGSGFGVGVVVTDRYGNKVPGARVEFTIFGGNGSVTPTSPTTDNLGTASAVWTIGTMAWKNVLKADVIGHIAAGTLTFEVIGIAGPPVAIEKRAGDLANAPPGTAVAPPPTVLVTDVHGNAVGGAQVTFAVVEGGGQITDATPLTDASGFASVGSWTLGSSGVNSLKASVSPTLSTTFTATAGTLVSGVIATNTTWKASESPYQLMGELKIESGVTLTIEPGVTVQASIGRGGIVRAIDLWGTLYAVGTADSPIIFHNIRFAGRGDNTNGAIPAFALVIEHAQINGGTLLPRISTAYGTLILRDSEIRNTGNHDFFQTWSYLHHPAGDSFIERNSFFNAQHISTGTISRDIFIRNNVFRGTSVEIAFMMLDSKTVLEHNSFVSSSVSLRDDVAPDQVVADVMAVNNWWGTTVEAEIEDKIRDQKDNSRIPRFILYKPFLTAPHSLTPP
jgi:adhesin/invasin